MKPHKGTLDNWFLRIIDHDKRVIFGNITGHPEFQDGQWIRTSLVRNYTQDECETLNSRYTLGVRDMDHE